MSDRGNKDLPELVNRGEPRSQSRRRAFDRGFLITCLAITAVAVLALGVLLCSILIEGLPGLRWTFFTEYASRDPSQAGIRAPLWGSIWVASICAIVALPIGIATAVWL